MVDGRQKTWYNTACDFPGRPYACVAQLVEQLTRNEQVAGSSPATSSKKTRSLDLVFFILPTSV